MIRLFFRRPVMWSRVASGYCMQVINRRFPLRGPFQQTIAHSSQEQTFFNINYFMQNWWEHSFFQRGSVIKALYNAGMISEQEYTRPPLPREPPPLMPPLPNETPPPPPPTRNLRMSAANSQDRVLPRIWSSTVSRGLTTRPAEGWINLSVATYNILAQNLLEDHEDLYSHCAHEFLDWEHRKVNLLSEIATHLPDILCMQEVQEDHYRDWFLPQLTGIGYNGEFLKRSGDKRDGCATFYKSSKLTLDKARFVEYFIPGVPVLNRDNVGLLLLLKPTNVESEARICVANTHLLFNPRRGDVKLAQLQLLFAEIDRLAYKESAMRRNKYDHNPPNLMYHPIVMCGDFNSLPKSKLYDFVCTGSLRYEGMPSKMISGQEKYPSSYPELHGPITPPSVGISDQCQFIDSFNYRYKLVDSDFIDTREIEELRHLHDLEVKEKYRRAETPRESPTRKRTTPENKKPQIKKKKGIDVSDIKIEMMSDSEIAESASRSSSRGSSASERLMDTADSSSTGEGQSSSAKPGAYAQLKSKNHRQAERLVGAMLGGKDAGACSVDSDGYSTVHTKKQKLRNIHVDLDHSNHDPHRVVIPREYVHTRGSHHHHNHHEILHEKTPHHVVMHKEEPHKHPQPSHDLHTHEAIKHGDHSFHPHDNTLTKTEQNLQKFCSVGSGTISHGFRLRSVYDHHQYVNGHRRPEATTCHGRANYTVDYIFFHRGTDSERRNATLRLIKRLNLYTDEEMFQLGGLPQKHLSSDHIVLLAGFHWKISDGKSE